MPLFMFRSVKSDQLLERAAYSVDYKFSLYLAICNFQVFPVLVLRAGIGL